MGYSATIRAALRSEIEGITSAGLLKQERFIHSPQAAWIDVEFPTGAQVKKVVNIPVCTVGKLGDPAVANQVLEQGKADFIALGRPLLADPYWPRKVEEGRIDEINRCIYCNNCVDRMLTTTREEKRLFCTVNPSLFREKEYAITKVSKPKNVMVIGGGTIGCEIAEMLASEGKRVTILEMLPKIGMDIGPTERFIMISSLREKGVDLQVAVQATGISAAGVEAACDGNTRLFEADTVIIATGMQPDNELFTALEGKLPEVYSIGDCVEAKRIGEAVKDAYRIALKL